MAWEAQQRGGRADADSVPTMESDMVTRKKMMPIDQWARHVNRIEGRARSSAEPREWGTTSAHRWAMGALGLRPRQGEEVVLGRCREESRSGPHERKKAERARKLGREREEKEIPFYFLKHIFKSKFNSNLNPFEIFIKPNYHK